MSQKTRSTAPRASGAQAKVPEARRKSMVENSAGSKVRSVSKDNRASNRRESVNPPVQNASKRSSSQHESRKVPAPQETNKKPPGHRDARSTSRQPEVRKSNLQPDGKAVPSRHDGKATAANPKTSSRPAAGVSKNKDALTSRLSNAGAKSPSRGSKVTAESSGQRHSRSNEKERELEKVAATSSSSGVSEKRPKTTHRAKTKATDRPPGGSAEAKQGHEAESEDDNYDDDFEDYESDFENDDGVDDESSASSAITDSSSSGSAPASGNDEAPSSKDAFRPTSDRLLAQEHSEVTSEQKLKEQSHWKSEPVLEVEAKPPAPLMPTSFSTYSLVSYLTAQKKEEEKKVLSKAQQRAKDVLEMVSLDTMTYQVFDVPPITYDVYISTFGRADAKQVLIQTDLGDEEECQTDAIECEDKWTQQPPHDYKGFGGGKNTSG
ncbi:hypothetical protein HPB52_017889 [Rhipicephalus sanguineus]|uniref:Uncharacterized protein n=1 Tax=Rhipicephalus sanguineus TaxID=34632 RepID=A0A9D4PUM5_RHISA|nr:hypothetical protein HPB52_017889 [Rhipicephalus sanguineus]